MSDQQLVTGLAILINGYISIQHEVSNYHWRIVTNLVWFSSVTHIASLLYLRQYFGKNRWLWYIWVFLMTGLAIMLAVGMALNGHTISDVQPMCCVLQPLPSNFEYYGPEQMLITVVIPETLILGGLVVHLVQMHTNTVNLPWAVLKSTRNLWIKSPVWICEQLESSPRLVQVISILLVVFSLVIFASIQCFVHFLGPSICGVSHY